MRRDKTAEEAYADQMAEARSMLASLADRLDRHAAKAAARPGDWCLVGDLTETLGHLKEALRMVDWRQP